MFFSHQEPDSGTTTVPNPDGGYTLAYVPLGLGNYVGVTISGWAEDGNGGRMAEPLILAAPEPSDSYRMARVPEEVVDALCTMQEADQSKSTKTM